MLKKSFTTFAKNGIKNKTTKYLIEIEDKKVFKSFDAFHVNKQ
jgi:hypothetical protein